MCVVFFFFFPSRRRHTRYALVTGVHTCALPILLQDEYGVTAKDVRWLVGDVDEREREAIALPALPDGFEIAAVDEDKLLSDMLAAGEIDCLLAYKQPRCFREGNPKVARPFPDWDAREKD